MPIYKMSGKKDGKQKYRVRINYLDGLGNARQIDRVAYGNEEAKMLEMRLIASIKEETPSKSLTVKELHKEYLKAKKPEVRESTLDKHKRIVECHVLPHIGEVKIHKLNVQALQAWKMAIEENALSLTTKQNIYATLRAMLNYAVMMEYIPKSPLSKLNNFKSSSELEKNIDFYTADEFKLFIQSAREYAENKDTLAEWGYYIFFILAFYTGMRKGEISALRWCDIDGNYLSVKRSIAQKLKGGDRVTPPKNKSSIRTIQLPTPVVIALAEHKARCEALEDFSDEILVCGGQRALRDNTVHNRNKEYATLAGVKIIRIHDFRHSHASLLANEGINIQEIARRLGHSKIEITWNTYSHLYPREEERAVEILNKIV